MVIVYIVVVPFVIALLVGIIIFPFWKVWDRIKTHHPDIWQSAGPFDFESLKSSPGLVDIFLTVVLKMNRDKEIQAKDPALAMWVKASVEVMRLIPKTMGARIVGVAVFVAFAFLLTKFLINH